MGQGRAGADHHFQERRLEARGREGTGHPGGDLFQAPFPVGLLSFDPWGQFISSWVGGLRKVIKTHLV